MSRIKNQHYVPQFYLKAFCPDGRSLFVFDKVTKRSFQTGVANIASEQRFYDLPPGPGSAGHPQVVENAFSRLEAGYADSVRDLLEEVDRHGRFTVGPSERNLGVAHFVALQYCRTRGFRDMHASMVQGLSAAVAEKHDMIRRHLAANDELVGDAMPLTTVSEENAPLEHAAFMFVGRFVESVMPVLLDHIWSIGDNRTPLPLFTSDAPVVRYPHVNHPPYGGSGFASTGVEILLPLSPRYVLILRERNHFAPLMRELTLDSDGAVLLLRPEGVSLYNRFQVWNSHRQIYGPQDEFDQIRELMEKFPAMCDQARPRFTISG